MRFGGSDPWLPSVALLEQRGCLSNPLLRLRIRRLILEARWGGWRPMASGRTKGPLQGESWLWEVT